MAFEIAIMGAADVGRAVDWAAAEGWNPGLSDGIAFQAVDPAGFLVGRLDGEPVGCISVMRYGESFGFLGFYIMTPQARGQGYGIRIWQAGMKHLAGRMVGLDGVPAQQENYRKSGFRLAWRNVRYQGVARSVHARAAGIGLVDARSLPFDRLAAYDRRFFREHREAFLSLWIALPGHVSLAALRDGALQGFGVIRPCRDGFKIGPLHAADANIATALAGALAAHAAGKPVALDVPEPNAQAVALAQAMGLKPVFETARMYTGPDPEIDRAGLYGITTFELG
jgi:RimJ/RimL family protein N-acetyltransferase